MLAMLLKNFLQTAINKDFLQNIYHKYFYDYYVDNIGIKTPSIPPYYSREFFKEIYEAEKEGYDTKLLKIKDWYNILIKKYITHHKEDGEYTLKPTRLEILYSHIDHNNAFNNIMKI